MDDSVTGLLFLGCLFFSAFFSSTETAYFSLSPLRLKRHESDGDSRASEILKVIADKQRLLVSLLMGKTLFNVSAVALAISFILRWQSQPDIPAYTGYSAWLCVGLAILLLSTIIFVCGEIIPKTVALFGGYKFSRLVIRPLRLFLAVVYPLAAIMIWLNKKVVPRYSDWNSLLGCSSTIEEIDSYVTLGEEAGIIEHDEKEMINSVFEFGDTLVREVMVPRPDVIAMPINTNLQDLLHFIREDGHSRFPVFDGSMDKILGILYVKDVLIKLDEIQQSYDLFKLDRKSVV